MQFLVLVFVLNLVFFASAKAQEGRWEFDFSTSAHGFVPGFADYPSNYDPSLYNLIADYLPRPTNLGSSPALFIGGHNRSDDLFMFWKKRLTGLPPTQAVRLTVELEFSSKYREGMVGVGGAPGEGVTMKIGATPFEPMPVLDGERWWRMNFNKGNQSVGGADMAVVGHIGKPDDGNDSYILLTRDQHGASISATTSADGSIWLVFGSDSGFEGLTELYYTRLTVWIDTVARPILWLEPSSNNQELRLVWNQGNLETLTDLIGTWTPAQVTDRPHRHTMNESRRFWRITNSKSSR